MRESCRRGKWPVGKENPRFLAVTQKWPGRGLNLLFQGKKCRQEIKVKEETGRTVFFTRKKRLAGNGATALSLGLPAFPLTPKNRNRRLKFGDPSPRFLDFTHWWKIY